MPARAPFLAPANVRRCPSIKLARNLLVKKSGAKGDLSYASMEVALNAGKQSCCRERVSWLKSKALTKIQAANVGVFHDILRLAVREHLAGMNDIGAVDEAQGFSDIVIGDQDPDAPRGEMSDELLDVCHGDWVHTSERLVQQHEVRPASERSGNLQATALAPGKGNGRRLAQMADVELFEQGIERAFTFLATFLNDLENGSDVFLHRQTSKDRGFLRKIADSEPRPPVHGHRGYIMPINMDRSLINRDEARDHIETGCLARAIGAEQAHRLARTHAEGYAADDLAIFVGLGQTTRNQGALEALQVRQFLHLRLFALSNSRTKGHGCAIDPGTVE